MTNILVIIRKIDGKLKTKKLKTFDNFFFKFLVFISNIEHFGKEDEPYNLNIAEIIDSKRRGYLNL